MGSVELGRFACRIQCCFSLLAIQAAVQFVRRVQPFMGPRRDYYARVKH
ncbi:MAG: hypothetical protein ACI81V_000833 [Lentimonas sp.]|jgi:hypothetical protein